MWRVSWFGAKWGAWTCQLTRTSHDGWRAVWRGPLTAECVIRPGENKRSIPPFQPIAKQRGAMFHHACSAESTEVLIGAEPSFARLAVGPQAAVKLSANDRCSVPEADIAGSVLHLGFGLTLPGLRAHNAPFSKVVRMLFANQTRDRLDHAASDVPCARQPPRRWADGRPAPTTTRRMALQNAQTNRCGGHRSVYGPSARQSAQVHLRSPKRKN